MRAREGSCVRHRPQRDDMSGASTAARTHKDVGYLLLVGLLIVSITLILIFMIPFGPDIDRLVRSAAFLAYLCLCVAMLSANQVTELIRFFGRCHPPHHAWHARRHTLGNPQRAFLGHRLLVRSLLLCRACRPLSAFRGRRRTCLIGDVPSGSDPVPASWPCRTPATDGRLWPDVAIEVARVSTASSTRT